jgi:alkanesulfonate monooxygenase SsuD/methylene tetrahydromethanopterin reductase-like flavin-dependent oxidoreductase (luciferase family)
MPLHKIGLLDFGIRSTEYFNSDMSVRVIKEALLAEKLGFSRVWYAEHYGLLFNNWLSADVIVSLVAGYTNTINVGIAGTLIQYYHPLKVAADYKMLSSIFPDRIDLGFAKGTVHETYQTLFKMYQDTSSKNISDLINEKISVVVKLINEEESNLGDYIILPPLKGSKPQLWNLGGSANGYLQALQLGINCSRSLIHPAVNLDPGMDILAKYKEQFSKKSGVHPQVNITTAGTCQKDGKAASRVIKELKKRNVYGIDFDQVIYGSPSEVYDKLSLLAETYGVDEVIFLELGLTDEQRKSSLKNISKVFNLKDP